MILPFISFIKEILKFNQNHACFLAVNISGRVSEAIWAFKTIE